MTATSWESETTQHGHSAIAAIRANQLRTRYPDAALIIERKNNDRTPNPMELYRYQIFVRQGSIQVKDDFGEHTRVVKDSTLLSRPFYEYQRETVLAEIKERFPDAILTEVKI